MSAYIYIFCVCVCGYACICAHVCACVRVRVFACVFLAPIRLIFSIYLHVYLYEQYAFASLRVQSLNKLTRTRQPLVVRYLSHIALCARDRPRCPARGEAPSVARIGNSRRSEPFAWK